MKKVFYIYILLNIYHLAFAQEGIDSLYNQANEAYSEGQFELAIELYEDVLESGFEAAELYYNLGNASFRSNKLGYSILYYNKALKLDPANEEAQKNLEYVSTYKEDKLEKVPEFFLRTWFDKLFHLFPVNTWSFVALFMFSFFMGGVLVYVFARNLAWKKTGFFFSLAATVLFIISISGAIRRNAELVKPDKAIIISPSVVVKSSPSLSGTDLFVLHEGTAVILDEKVGDWVEIKISDGRVGWISEESMELI